MLFEQKLYADAAAALALLGYGSTAPDKATARRLARAKEQVETSATPRWVAVEYELSGGPLLKTPALLLPGEDIARHLAGCTACVLLAVTLGTAVEQLTRATETSDMALAVLVDGVASALVEYADEAQRLLRQKYGEQAKYLTARYSPGYGDFPIALQGEVLRLLDGPRAIGLTVSAGGLLLPRKSITALLGVAGHPVDGRLAGCEHCALREKCGALTGGSKLCRNS